MMHLRKTSKTSNQMMNNIDLSTWL